MKVTLNIENDAELRAYIKDCIRGQVLAIVREDFFSIIKNELERKIKGTDESYLLRMQEDAMISVIREILMTKHSVSRYNDNFIRPYVIYVVNDAIKDKDWGKMVDDLAKEKVRSLIK